MTELKVWAPEAEKVSVDLEDERIVMNPEARGWWSVVIRKDPPFDYAFVLNDGPPMPDPRSPWQPCGVHGQSRTMNHAEFQWTDAGWQAPPLSSAVVYELHIGTFTEEGTFDAAIKRIPHLLYLGVTHVELMPVASFPGHHGWGYDGVAIYAPHRAYGGPEGLKRLIDALHANGLAAILDVVYNHLGPSGNYLDQYGPYFDDNVKTPWGDAVNLSGAGSDSVRQFFIENAVMWLRDYHFDGLRLDAVHALIDTSATHFLRELADRVKRFEAESGRHLALVAESDLNDPRLLAPPDAGGHGLDAQWSDDFHHAIHALLTGERSGYYSDFGSLEQLAKALEKGFVYDGCYSEFRDRRHGRPLDGLPRNKLFGYVQNHDQVGNRAQGDRISALVNPDRMMIGAALTLTGPFVPMLFQGEEWAAGSPFQYFTDHTEEELGRAVTEGRQTEFADFGWQPSEVPDPQAIETFERSKLPWRELDEPEHARILAWYRALIKLRKQAPELRWAETKVTFDEDDGYLRMDRGGISVHCNFGQRPLSIDGQNLELRPDSVVILHGSGSSARLLLSSAAGRGVSVMV